MTTAHRPTFDPARGKEAKRGPAYHQRLLPAHTTLKTRQSGQGGAADAHQRDLRAELLAAEAAAFTKKDGAGTAIDSADQNAETSSTKRLLETNQESDEDAEVKRRRLLLQQAAELDADSAGSDSEESSSEEEDDEDDELALMLELEKIKKERAEQRAKEEAEKVAKEQEEREYDIAVGNPLLNSKNQDFNVKRRWDDDVVFKNQARGTEDKRSKEFVNDLLRSDFHKRFMNRYVR